MFIAITMTGMDQEMMQKNISCRTVGESQKNMITFSFVLVIVTLLFLGLGVLIWDYVGSHQELADAIKNKLMVSDELFPGIALNKLGTASAVCFIIGLISAAYPSADGALTALTASFCIDFLGFNDPAKGWTEERRTKVRKQVHIGFSVLLFFALLLLKAVNDNAVIDLILFLATITYGPLLGLFAFGLFMKGRTVKGWPVVVVCVLAPAICFLLNFLSVHDVSLKHAEGALTFDIFNGYIFGNELLIINGLLVFTGLFAISVKTQPADH
jgi:Na+/pantothenate symporter